MRAMMPNTIARIPRMSTNHQMALATFARSLAVLTDMTSPLQSDFHPSEAKPFAEGSVLGAGARTCQAGRVLDERGLARGGVPRVGVGRALEHGGETADQ